MNLCCHLWEEIAQFEFPFRLLISQFHGNGLIHTRGYLCQYCEAAMVLIAAIVEQRLHCPTDANVQSFVEKPVVKQPLSYNAMSRLQRGVQSGRIPGFSNSVVVRSVGAKDGFHVGVLEDGSQAGLRGPSSGVGIGVDAIDIDE